MSKCPLTGQPCPNDKLIHITIIQDYQATGSIDCCQVCADEILSLQEKKPEEIVHPAMSLFEMLVAMIHEKFGLTPTQKTQNQVIFTKPGGTPPPGKSPCPKCGTSLNDINKTKRLGCPGCYEHYRQELLPVLIHAHKCCEHVGKSPQNRIVSNEEKVRILELQLKAAIEQEKYEQAIEVKKELDALKKDTSLQQ